MENAQEKTFAEQAREALENLDLDNLSEEDKDKLQQDIFALNDFESLCSDGCLVTEEYKQLFQKLFNHLSGYERCFAAIKANLTDLLEVFVEYLVKAGSSEDEFLKQTNNLKQHLDQTNKLLTVYLWRRGNSSLFRRKE